MLRQDWEGDIPKANYICEAVYVTNGDAKRDAKRGSKYVIFSRLLISS